MRILLRIVFLLGFCAATVGAAGFATPREPEALPLLVGGLLLVAGCGFAGRRLRRADESVGSGAAGRAELAAALQGVVAAVQAVRDDAPRLGDAELAARLDAILVPCAALGNRNEEFMRSLGLAEYTRVWDGFATGERLLARAWSMAADGFAEASRAEIPKACAHFERAAAAHG